MGPSLFHSLLLSLNLSAIPATGVLVTSIDEGDGWLEHRMIELVSGRLNALGVDVHDWRFVAPGRWSQERLAEVGVSAVLVMSIRPTEATRPDEVIQIDATYLAIGRGAERAKFEGEGAKLSLLATKIAGWSAATAGWTAAPSAPAERPFLMHQLLGEASRDLLRGRGQEGWLKYERVLGMKGVGLEVDALDGALRARALLQRRDPELADSLLEKASMSIKKNDFKGAQGALLSFLKLTPHRARHWSIELALDPDSTVVFRDDKAWRVVSRESFTVVPETGAITSRDRPLTNVVGFVGGLPLTLSSKVLTRFSPGTKPQWKKTLPFEPSTRGPLPVTGGQAALFDAERLLWVELGLGALSDTVRGFETLVVGADGALGRSKTGELALYRPGRVHPAWSVAVDAPVGWSAVMISERALVLAEDKLLIHDAATGKLRGEPLPLRPGATWLGGDGRYGVIAYPDGVHELYDVLGSHRTATLRWPSRGVLASGTTSGVAIVYETGDVLHYDRDGVVLDRTHVKGKPLLEFPGSPLIPGPVVVTTRGLFALGEVPDGGGVRDVDALVMLVELLEKSGDETSASVLATHYARASIGRIERFEGIRARHLTGPAKTKALDREKAARNHQAPLPDA